LSIDTRIVIYGFDFLGIRDLIDIENTGDVESLQLILPTELLQGMLDTG